MRFTFKVLKANLFILLAFSLTILSAQATQLLPHRIIYDLKMKEATSRSGISNLVGRIVYEFRGSKCDGYTINFRSVSEIYTEDFTRVSDQQSSSYESPDGTFSFVNRTFVDQELDREVSGHATKEEDSILVEYKTEDRDEVSLPMSTFPTANLIDLIERAKAGETIYESRVFDGSEGGEKSYITTSIIGALEEPANIDAKDDDPLGDLASEGFWPVSVSYFEENEEGDALPVYRFAFKLYENGVSRDLTIDHGYLVISGTAAGFEILEEEADCE